MGVPQHPASFNRLSPGHPHCDRKGRLFETVRAAAEEFEEAQVAEDLELLTDFGADMKILGMEFNQRRFGSVDFLQIEF